MNDNIVSIGKSISAELIAEASRLNAEGLNVIGLAGGEPDFTTPASIRIEAIKALCMGETHYNVGKGLKELRDKIAYKLRRDNAIECDSEEIIVTPGAKYAIYMAIRALVTAGDEVMILNPSWVSYGAIVKAANGIPIYLNLRSENNYYISQDLLESVYSKKVKAMIINMPNNPTGRILSEEEASAIRAFLLRHPDVYLVSDEIYEQIVFEKRHISLASYSDIADRVITVNGFSKAYAMTGWRVGYLHAKKRIIDGIYNYFVHTITGLSPFIQRAAITAMDCNEDVEGMRKQYHLRRDYIYRAINQMPGMRMECPEGTFYAWIDITNSGKKSNEFCRELLHFSQILVVPGTAYGNNGEGFIRLSFASKLEDLQIAMDRMKKYVTMI